MDIRTLAEDGPALWFSDGHKAARLDAASSPGGQQDLTLLEDRDLYIIRALLEVATERILGAIERKFDARAGG